jgi:ketosteroid isomerase-like protein
MPDLQIFVKTILSMSRRSIPLAYLFALVSCSRHAFDPVSEQARLLRPDAEWADLASAGKDVDNTVSFWSDNAILIFPGQPVLEGKPAIRAYVKASLKTPGFKITRCQKSLYSRPIASSPTCAALTSSLFPDPTAQRLRCTLEEYQSGAGTRDGQWRCVVDISNEEPSAPPAAN